MFARSSKFIREFAPVGCVAALLLVGPGSAISAEPIQFSKPEQKPDATQEKKESILKYRAYRPSQSISGPRLNEQMPLPAVSAPVAPPQSTNRRNQETLDRQKNWIFVSPGDDKADSAEDIFGVGEMTLDGQSKGVIAKFLENKPSTDPKASGANAWDKDEKNEFGAPSTFGLGNEKQNKSGGSLQPNAPGKDFFGSRGDAMNISEFWKEQNGPRADKMREEKQIRMNEFHSLFNSQSAVPAGGALGGLNNFGLQPASPLLGGSDSFGQSPPAYRAPDANRNIARAVPGAGTFAQPNINTRVFGQSAVTAPTPEPTRATPQPAVLPIPKRRF